jgi:ubiquinone/menaquinone biosynthesis C-methylase UbiE
LPWLFERVGPTGAVSALDLDPDNVRTAELRCEAAGHALDATCAPLRELPYADASFDAVWCANVSWLLSDDDLMDALTDIRRVLRPGGRLGLKDVDMSCLRLYPAPPFLGPHLAETCVVGENVKVESIGSLRGRELRRWLVAAGFVDVVQQSFPIERWAPLAAVETQLWSEWLPYLAALALERGVPAEDAEVWRQLSTPESAAEYISRPDFSACEIQAVAVGSAPGRTE